MLLNRCRATARSHRSNTQKLFGAGGLAAVTFHIEAVFRIKGALPMKSRTMLPALVAVGLLCIASASNASAFELLNRLSGGACGCDAAPACGCDNVCAPKCCREPRCRPERCRPHLHIELHRCCKPACEPKCGCETTCAAPAPKCGCEVASCCQPKCREPKCCKPAREPRCCKPKCCREPRCCKPACKPTCGCDTGCAAPAPKCGCGA